MKKYTKQDIMDIVEEEDVRFILCSLQIFLEHLKMWQLLPVNWRRL